MAGAGSIFDKIGASLKKKPAAPATAAPSQKAGIKPTSTGKKPFDINLYFKAVGMAFSDFFGKKISYFFKNMGPVFKNFPNWWGKLPQDEQISYGVLLLGHMMVLVGIVLIIIL